MPTPRSAASVVVFDSKIYVMGGRNASGKVVATVERYLPDQDRWETGLSSLEKARENAAAVVFQGSIFLIGGRDNEDEILKKVEFLQGGQGEWHDFEEMEYHREGPGAAVLDGRLYALGGFGSEDDDGRQPAFLSDVERYNSGGEEDEWEGYSSWRLMVGAASFGSVTYLDSVFIFGGFSNLGPLTSVYRYTNNQPAAERAAMRSARGGLAYALANDEIIVVGGRLSDDKVTGGVDIFRIGENRWIEATPLPKEREFAAAAFVNDRLYVIGGRDQNEQTLSSVVSASRADLVTGVQNGDDVAPGDFHLLANYPNPFNPSTVIEFNSLPPESGSVSLEIYNIRGIRVISLLDAFLPAGRHRVQWDGRDISGLMQPSGVYFAVLTQGRFHISRKLILQR